MSDNTLTTLMGNVPSRFVANMSLLFSHLFIHSLRCILLLEDLDAAFTRLVSRDEKSIGAPTATTSKKAATAETTYGSTLSLSGLLISLDGVAAAEGRYVYLLPLCVPFYF